MTPDEFLRKYGLDDQSLKEREHSLQENSRERASRPHQPNAGSPHDWELWQKLHDEVEVSDDPDPFRPTRNLPPQMQEAASPPGFWHRLKRLFTGQTR
ncbi:MAG: hypothetical protein EA349_10170 [Halomonadaceae bacterium]|nr:MAG: hypothetical protein EA349_10170 [Halomonadaceae bacterium]